MTTHAPRSSSWRAISNPIPLDPPVTSARFPEIFIGSLTSTKICIQEYAAEAYLVTTHSAKASRLLSRCSRRLQDRVQTFGRQRLPKGGESRRLNRLDPGACVRRNG